VTHQVRGLAPFSIEAMAPHHAKLPTYERELIGLVKAVRNWRPYLWGRAFTVCTDHHSLKFLLDEWLTTIPQHNWVSKSFGYDITIEYCPGKQNVAANALSRRDDDEESVSTMSLSSPSFELFLISEQSRAIHRRFRRFVLLLQLVQQHQVGL